jgi:hypothetical protein
VGRMRSVTMSVITDPTGATLAMWQPKGGK